MSGQSTPEPSVSRKHVPLPLLALIAFSGTLAMHIFVPALPQAAQALQTGSQTIQLTITVYILGLVIGQLIYGPVSDAVGRRPAVLGGLVIYLLGSIAAFLAPDVQYLIAARLLQALGGAGGLVLARAIVADTAADGSATRELALLNLVLLIAPGLAPLIGAAMAQAWGWQTIFVFLVAMAVVTLWLSFKALPETATPSRVLNPGKVVADFSALLKNRRFLALAVGGAFGSTGSYVYFVAAPFILHSDMGLDVQLVGMLISLTLVAAACGCLGARALAGRVDPHRVLLMASATGAVTGLVFLLLALTSMLTPVAVVVMSCIVLFCAGALSPTAVGTALAEAGKQAGSAAGIYGAMQMTSGVICTFFVSFFADQALGCGLGLALAYGLSVLLLARR